MLRALHIRDFVIVAEAEIHFEDGFTVFSGETGAGKSILIDALALTLGGRADAAVLRQNTARAEITAVFDCPSSVAQWLAANDLQADDELILRRVIDLQGRSRAYANGSPVNASQLREIGDHLVDIHGQHAHQSLLRADSQRDLLDAHGGHQPLRLRVAQAWKAWRQIEKQLSAAEQDAGSLALAREKLEWQTADLDRLAVMPGEWEEISSTHSRLANGQALLDGAAQTLAALDEDELGVNHQLAVATQRIGQLLRHDPALSVVHDALESAQISIGEAVSDLNAYVSRLEPDPDQLAATEERMRAIFEMARKLRTEPDQLHALHQDLKAQLAALEASADIDALRQQATALQAAYHQAADTLSQARRTAARDLAAQVTRAMQTLAMQGGQFEITLEPSTETAHGKDQIEFLVAGHAGTVPRALSKVASGGELARISLALSVIASRAARVPTLIFDEVDSGIGGGVAEVVGNLLRELGARHQVLCVTHLPQVAARGQHHFCVSKRLVDGMTESDITTLDAEARVEEIARMLGGLKITTTTRDHAREMLKDRPD
ncbi:MAG: DNA repair protein RecN [Burkholderiaceae bacterium]|nr:DNA repair protein RecN [Burkholderiaceae bacterium]